MRLLIGWLCLQVIALAVMLKYTRWIRTDEMAMDIVFKLPKWVIYYAVIKAWSNATTGKYGNSDPSTVTLVEALDRLYDANSN